MPNLIYSIVVFLFKLIFLSIISVSFFKSYILKAEVRILLNEFISFFVTVSKFISISIVFIIGFYFVDSYRYLIPVMSRLILGFIFIYFSWDKIVDPSLFAKLVKNYDIVPLDLVNISVLILPWIEFIIGLCLILGIFLDVSAIISLSLLLLFIISLNLKKILENWPAICFYWQTIYNILTIPF